jgi:hypothetical protein
MSWTLRTQTTYFPVAKVYQIRIVFWMQTSVRLCIVCILKWTSTAKRSRTTVTTLQNGRHHIQQEGKSSKAVSEVSLKVGWLILLSVKQSVSVCSSQSACAAVSHMCSSQSVCAAVSVCTSQSVCAPVSVCISQRVQQSVSECSSQSASAAVSVCSSQSTCAADSKRV